MIDLVLGTRNPKKLAELEALLSGAARGRIRLHTVQAWASMPAVEESADTFMGNAILKARATADFTGLWALADDSGLEVDALGGAPGVRSARYAGEHATDAQNNETLLRALKNVEAAFRTGRFWCAMVICAPDRHEPIFQCQEACEGIIAERSMGGEGFGYDPLFIPLGFDVSFAVMPSAQKHRLSHRGKAMRQVARFLETV